MIPIRDVNPIRTTPWVTYALIIANIAVFLFEYSLIQVGASWVIPGYGLVPRRLVGDPVGELFTVFTSMFMHGGWAHLLGNMLFLYIFGDNIEDALGHLRFSLFYAIGGIAAGTAQVVVDPSSAVPMVGASGAIAAVLGAYLVLYPRAPVQILNTVPPLWLFIGLTFEAPAWMVLGYWFVLQNLLPGVTSLALPSAGGVAFFAHLGGFVAGLLLIRPFRIGRPPSTAIAWRGWRPPPQPVRSVYRIDRRPR